MVKKRFYLQNSDKPWQYAYQIEGNILYDLVTPNTNMWG